MPERPTTLANGSQMKPAQLRTFHERLAGWYKTHGRHDLPWRNTSDPYRIWLSEVMLQQTQVATVRDRFYGPFLDRFPTVADLSAAPREAVMKAWEGLGYYRRAGFLHEASREITRQNLFRLNNRCVAEGEPRSGGGKRSEGDKAPPSIEELISLPGIGKNTARAILAFAYHQPVAILEANVKRVVARAFALEHPTENELWEGAEKLLNHAEPFNYNQAMMDLGSMVCTPKNPNCDECPANTLCQGQGEPEIYPAPKAKKRVPVREMNVVVVEDSDGKIYLESRDAALLGGLYGFVQLPLDMEIKSALPRGTTQVALIKFGRITHIYSHFRLEAQVHHAVLQKSMPMKNWYTRAEINTLPLSGVDHKVLKLMDGNAAKKPARKKT